jgi:hypothetical protein
VSVSCSLKTWVLATPKFMIRRLEEFISLANEGKGLTEPRIEKHPSFPVYKRVHIHVR